MQHSSSQVKKYSSSGVIKNTNSKKKTKKFYVCTLIVQNNERMSLFWLLRYTGHTVFKSMHKNSSRFFHNVTCYDQGSIQINCFNMFWFKLYFTKDIILICFCLATIIGMNLKKRQLEWRLISISVKMYLIVGMCQIIETTQALLVW